MSARLAFRDVLPTFPHRQAHLRAVIAAIRGVTESASLVAPGSSMVRFDPPVPRSSLVHVYIGLPLDAATRAVDAVEARCGIRVLSRLRDVADFKGTGVAAVPPCARDTWTVCGAACYSEWNMGVLNGALPVDVFVSGWRELLSECVSAAAAL